MSEPGSQTQSYPMRRVVVFAVFLAGMIALALRALELQVLQHDFLQEMGDARHLRVVHTPALRGMITDRHGEPLAVSAPVDSIWINPLEYSATQEQVTRLATLLDMRAVDLNSRIRERGEREFVYIKRHISPELAAQIKALGVAGLNVQREYRRYYPMLDIASHVVGFTNIDDIGQEGMELTYNDWLSGEPGAKRVIKDRRGLIIGDVELIRQARPGNDLRLSIDGYLQYLAYSELRNAVRKFNAESGSVVVLDPHNGEILAMVNQPGYNPNNRAELKPELFLNRAVKDLFEPGSTAKPFTIAAAVDSNVFQYNSKLNTNPGSYAIPGHVIKDKNNLGVIDMTTVISKSSNVGAAMVAMKVPSEQLWHAFHDFGFGQRTQSHFPGEEAGFLRDFTGWYPADKATLSYGYGFSVTSLQLAQAYAVLAADGVFRPVTFIAGMPPREERQVVSAETARAVRRMMQKVVSPEGTGYRASVEGYRVAGKTGTAKKAAAGGYGDEYQAVFAGMVPADQPRLVAVVMINEPKGGQYYGGDVAAPVFANIMAGALRQFNIPPNDLPGQRIDEIRVAATGDSQ
ncbi:MAG: peptidoglycan D,D-transpeptidase FtsI family protein [Thiotrichales bacterium]